MQTPRKRTMSLPLGTWRALTERKIEIGARSLADVIEGLLALDTRMAEPGQLATGSASTQVATPEGERR